MSIEDQKRIVKDYDVLLERCYAQNMGGGKYKSNLPENLEVIREVGYKNVLISTDGGQTENPHWEIAMQQYLNICRIMVCRTTRFTTCRIPLRQACSASSNAEEVE